MQQQCTKCGETKPLGQFARRADTARGTRSACKPCDNVVTRARYWADPARERARERRRLVADRQQRCTTCGEIKPLDDFARDGMKSVGVRSACKTCNAAAARARYRADPAPERQRNRAYKQANQERIAAYNARRRQEPAVRARHQAAVTRWVARQNARDPERMRLLQRTRMLVFSAIALGLLTRPEACAWCAATGRQITAAHHDYSRPLDVVWLCRPCHSRWDHAEPKLFRG